MFGVFPGPSFPEFSVFSPNALKYEPEYGQFSRSATYISNSLILKTLYTKMKSFIKDFMKKFHEGFHFSSVTLKVMRTQSTQILYLMTDVTDLSWST